MLRVNLMVCRKCQQVFSLTAGIECPMCHSPLYMSVFVEEAAQHHAHLTQAGGGNQADELQPPAQVAQTVGLIRRTSMKKFKGIYPDKFLECEAETEEEAQIKMKKLLIEEIEKDMSPIIIWDEGEVDSPTKRPPDAGDSSQ